MIGWRVANIVERLACHCDDVWLANFERVGGFDVEAVPLICQEEHYKFCLGGNFSKIAHIPIR